MIDPQFYSLIRRALYCMPMADEGGVLVREWEPYLSNAGKDFFSLYAERAATKGFWQIMNGCAVFNYASAAKLREYTTFPGHHFLNPDDVQECLRIIELEEEMSKV